jgi:hypothetical protein
MATVQPDWDQLAADLNVSGPDEAQKLAFKIAAYVAEVQKSGDKELMLKEGGKYFNLKLGSLKRGA